MSKSGCPLVFPHQHRPTAADHNANRNTFGCFANTAHNQLWLRHLTDHTRGDNTLCQDPARHSGHELEISYNLPSSIKSTRFISVIRSIAARLAGTVAVTRATPAIRAPTNFQTASMGQAPAIFISTAPTPAQTPLLTTYS